MNKIKHIPLKYFIPLLLIIITFTIFCRVISYDFVDIDDNVNVWKNPYMNPVTASSIRHFWKKPHFFALTYTAWAVQAAFARTKTPDPSGLTLDPHIFHTTNLIFHILNVLLVFLILKILVKHNWAAFSGALLFALHPVQVEPVAWVTGLKDLLSGFFSLVAVWQYLLFAKFKHASGSVPKKNGESYPDGEDDSKRRRSSKAKKKWIHYIFSLISFILAMTAKPTTIIVPVIILILDIWILKRPVKESITLLSGWIIISLPIIVLVKSFQPDILITFITPLWARPFVIGDTLAFYLYKLVFPFSLGIDYGRLPEFVFQHRLTYPLWIIPYILLILLWYYRKHTPYLAASAGIFIVGILPVSGLIPFLYQIFSTIADRYLYFAMLGPAMALAWFLSHNWKKPIIIISALILIFLGMRCWDQIKYWKNSVILFKHALDVNYNSWNSHNYMGLILEKGQKKYDEAIIHYSEAIRANPNFFEAYNNMGVALKKQGKLEQAIACYWKAIRINPAFYQAYFNAGGILQEQGRIKKAMTNYLQALRIKPDFVRAFYSLGACLEKQGKHEQAIAYYSKAVQIKPGYARSYFERGNALLRLGRLNEAAADYKQVLKIKPGLAEAHNNLGLVLETQGKFSEAIFHYSEALRINPGYKSAGNNLSRVKKKLK